MLSVADQQQRMSLVLACTMLRTQELRRRCSRTLRVRKEPNNIFGYRIQIHRDTIDLGDCMKDLPLLQQLLLYALESGIVQGLRSSTRSSISAQSPANTISIVLLLSASCSVLQAPFCHVLPNDEDDGIEDVGKVS